MCYDGRIMLKEKANPALRDARSAKSGFREKNEKKLTTCPVSGRGRPAMLNL